MPKKKKIKKKSEEEKINGIDHFLRTQKLTVGQKAADKVTTFAGSWLFIFLVFFYLSIWISINTIWIIYGKIWDPYPFILLNLTLSCLAAIQAPIILMSQNRAADRDRIKSERDYIINRKAEREIKEIQKELKSIRKLIKKPKRRKK